MTHLDTYFLLWYFTKGVSCQYWVDSSVIFSLRIFLFGILYLDAVARGVSDTGTTFIISSRISWLLMKLIKLV